MDPILEKPIGKKFIGFKYFDFVDVKASEGEERIIEGFITARTIDREKDRVFPESFLKQFARFEENPKLLPVILYVHDQRTRLPVGKILKFEIRDGRVWFRGMLSKSTQFADEVWGQVKEGILKTFSFGYLLHDFTTNAFGGKDFKETEVAEVSFAPVAVQEQALIDNFKALEETLNLKKEEIKMTDFNLAEDKTFTDFSNKMAQFSKDILERLKETDEGQKKLQKMVDEKKVDWTPEEKQFMDNLLIKMQEVDEKTGAISKELATRFPTRNMEFPAGDPKPIFTGEKAYENLVECPKEFISDDKMAKRVTEWQKMHDTIMLGNAILFQKYQGEQRQFPGVKFKPIWEFVQQKFVQEKDGFKSLRRLVTEWTRLGDEITGGELTKVLAPGTAGAGLEFIPTQFSAQLFDRVRAALLLAGRFNQVSAPSDPYKWPVAGGDIYGVGVAASTALPTTLDSASTPTATANVTFTHSKMRLRDAVAAEEIEDSIVAIIPYVNERLAIGAAKTLERAIINGDNLTPHQDTDVQAVGEATKGFRLGIAGVPLWNGLRWLTINTEVASAGLVNAGGTGAFSLGDIQDGMAKLGKFGLPTQLNNLVHVMGIPAYYLAMKFAELLTIEKFGPFATVVNGVLTKVLGIDVLPSGEFPVNLTGATAVNDLGANNTTSWIIVNTNTFAVSYRRGFQLESVRLAAQDMFDIFGFLRVDFKYFYPSSNGKFGVAGGFGDADPGAVQVHNIIA